jgi:hypothetical protein
MVVIVMPPVPSSPTFKFAKKEAKNKANVSGLPAKKP